MFDVTAPYSARTLQRDMLAIDDTPMPYLARLASHVHHYGEHGATLAYLDLLDRALADLVITDQEAAELTELAGILGLTRDDVAGAHRRYIDELVAAALRDGVVTDDEHDLLHRAATALGVDPDIVDADTAAWRPDGDSGGITLQAGMRVCFTGAATYPDGTELPRKKLNEVAAELGLEPTSNVTKKACDVLVAADPSSQSGKVGKARKYGIPIVDVHDLLVAQPGSTVPALVIEPT